MDVGTSSNACLHGCKVVEQCRSNCRGAVAGAGAGAVQLPVLGLIIVSIILLASCAGAPLLPETEPIASGTQPVACMKFFRGLDEAVVQSGVRDVGEAPVHGFPYLRTNRFLSSYRHASLVGEAFEAWVDRLHSLDYKARKIELSNLPAGAVRVLSSTIPDAIDSKRDPQAAIEFCAQLLRKQHLSTQAGRSLLQKKVVVSPDYNTGKRVIGLYTLARLPVAYGIHRWHLRMAGKYRGSLDALPIHGVLMRFVPASGVRLENASQVADLLNRSNGNPLGIPEPSQEQSERLFATFAPVFEVDIVTNDDRIGAPYWPDADVSPAVDTASPIVYRHLSHTRFKGRPLLQLNYVIWFPARTCTSVVDILCGHMDGINWRVTLSPEGEVLLFDSIHNCGCYHMFFPSGRIKPRQLDTLDETAFVPLQAPDVLPTERLVLRIASGTHHIEAVHAGQAKDGLQEAYAWADYRTLRSLTRRDGSRHSLFQPDGLVPGTDRKERWLLWPMGVLSPGAMRQWGHHATAFVGRRHFDDPCLIEAYFSAAEEDASSGTADDSVCTEKSRLGHK